MTRKGFWKTLIAGLVGGVGIGKSNTNEKKSNFPRICKYNVTGPEFNSYLGTSDTYTFIFEPEKRRCYLVGTAIAWSQTEYDEILEMLSEQVSRYGRWYKEHGYPTGGVASFISYTSDKNEVEKILREFKFLRKWH